MSSDDKYRLKIEFDKIPKKAIDALLAKEDQGFFYHFGVNPWSLLRAAWTTSTGGRKVGGSTITMQVARIHFDLKTRSIGGKLKQILYGLFLETTHSKKEILEAYFSLAPYGGNIEGIEAAARIYFGVRALELTQKQIEELTEIPQNPNLRHLKMVREQPFLAPHFVDLLLKRHSEKAEFYTTLDLSIQALLEAKTRSYVERVATKGIHNASAMILNIESGEVLAMLGSNDYWNAEINGQVNGTTARRSPGSSLKPFVYALALEKGIINPQSLLQDIPSGYGNFDPENFDRKFKGPVSATEALIQSRNVPAVDLSAQLSAPTFYEFLKALAVPLHTDPKFYGLGLTLGNVEVTMEEMLTWYLALARRSDPQRLKYFTDEEPRLISHWPLSPESSYLVLNMLSQNPRDEEAIYTKWKTHQTPTAWKTGTSQGYRDAWTIGLVGPYAIAVWLGDFGGESNPALIGRDVAAPLFFELADGLLNHNPAARDGFPLWATRVGLNLKRVKVCSLSGAKPEPHCPHTKWVDVIPAKTVLPSCDLHQKIWVTQNGHRLCPNREPSTSDVEKVFEFWPSEILKVYSSMGVRLQVPPAFEKTCEANYLAESGEAPRILSPRQNVEYALSLGKPDQWEIPLVAAAESDVQQISWFIDKSFIGQSAPSRPLLWKAQPGSYSVTALDNVGRSQSIKLNVKLER